MTSQVYNAEIPKSPRPASYTHQNSKGTHQLLTTCVLGTNRKISTEYKDQWWDPFPMLWDP